MKPFAAQGVRPFTAASNILGSDAVVLLEADPQKDAPVMASYIRVATIVNGAKLINVSSGKSPFEGITDVHVPAGKKELVGLLDSLRGAVRGEAGDVPAALKEAAEILRSAKKPVIVIGCGAMETNPAAVVEAVNLAIDAKAFFDDGIGLVPVLRASNSLGALNTVTGDSDWLSEGNLDFLYVLSTGMIPEDQRALSAMAAARFVVVHTPFIVHPLVNMADVLLPAPAWFERSGHYCTLGEGWDEPHNRARWQHAGAVGHPEGQAERLGFEMQRSSAAPCENVYESKSAPETAKTVVIEEVL